MRTYNYSDLSKQDIQKLVQRNVDPADEIRNVVEDIINNVRANGARAMLEYAAKLDKVELKNLLIGKDELALRASELQPEQKKALDAANNNNRKLHEPQLHTEAKIEPMPGVP